MKKKLAIILVSLFLISTFTITSFATERHSTPSGYGNLPDSPTTKVSAEKEKNTDNPVAGDDTVGTDFYIYDYQDKILSFQLTADVTMKVAVAVAGDGAVLVPSQNSYGITNYSGYPINVTTIAVDAAAKAANWTLAEDGAIAGAGLNAKTISVKLGNIDLANASALATPGITIPASKSVSSGEFKALDITAKATTGNAEETASSGYAFTVVYTLELDKA